MDEAGYQLSGLFGYFWSPMRGLVFCSGNENALIYPNSSYRSKIFYTNDGGVTWLSANVNCTGGLGGGSWGRMLMWNDSTGWLTNLPANISCKTTDSGKTWLQLNTNGGDDVYLDAKDSVQFLIDAMAISKMTDSIWIKSSYFRTGPWTFAVTKDAGNTWATHGISSNPESSGIFASPSWGLVFTGHEAGVPLVSRDSGSTWSVIPQLLQLQWPNSTTGDVEGGLKSAYMQLDVYGSERGLYRSIDSGKTWENIGGPSNHNDTRFCVIDCNGAEVVAFDDSGGIWLTTDGGDGAVTYENAHPKFSSNPVLAVSPLCQSIINGFRIYNDHCDSIVILSLTVLDTNDAGVRAGALGLDSVPTFPLTMKSGADDSLLFHWNPLGTFLSDTLRVNVHYFSQTTHTTGDTILTIIGKSNPIAPQLSSRVTSVDFVPISTCSSRDTTITFTNPGCAPDTITALALSGSGFTGPKDSLPIIVPPGDSVSLAVSFLPPDSGSFQSQLGLHVTSMGLTENPVVTLSGKAMQGLGILDVRNTSIAAGSFSFCAGDTTITDTIANTGCDTLVISKLSFSGDTAFSLVSASGDSLLAPGTVRVFTFTFAPRAKGAHAATLAFHSQNIVNDPGHDTVIALAGTGLPGTTILSADTTTRNFGALYACESRDITITLYNPGCDTLVVDSASVTNGSFATDAIFPVIILPGDSVTVPVHLTSTGTTLSTITSAVTFFSNANQGSSTATVPMQASIIQPAQLHLALSQPQSGENRDMVTFYLTLTGTGNDSAVNAITFNLMHNNDLLSFLSASGVTVTGTGGTPALQVQHILISPLLFKEGAGGGWADTIGSLTFQVYLTDSTETPLTLSNISFNNSLNLPNDCIASIDDASSGFTYTYQCGEQIIQDAMNSIPFSITSIVPNPAQNEITISGAGLQSTTVALYDVLGREQDVRGTSLQNGVSLDVSNIPSGNYYLRMSESGFVQTRKIAIER